MPDGQKKKILITSVRVWPEGTPVGGTDTTRLGHVMALVNNYAVTLRSAVLAVSGRLQGFVVLFASLFKLLPIHPTRIIFEVRFNTMAHKCRCLTVVKRTT